MKLSAREVLRQLGSGESIETVCQAAGIDRPQFDEWWQQTIGSRVPAMSGLLSADLASQVVIERDRRGIPHIFAANDADLFFGFGVAMAQDRLFQLDYLRRKGSGRLSEILGTSALPLDTIARTVGLQRIARAEWDRLEPRIQALIEAFTSGVNRVITDTAEAPAIEFDLLDYRPEPWQPVDCLLIECEFRWYLTGRLPVIAIPELARRILGEGPLLNEFLLGEADEESILHPGDYDPSASADSRELIGQAMNDPEAHVGSNNWVISGDRTTTGQPLVASDPHIAFEAVSCWYEVHLCGGSFNVTGMTYAGMPAVMFGRNEHVAWGMTNNICSLRDLYQERTCEDHPGCFLFDGQWEPERRLTESIRVKGGNDVQKVVRFSRNGPLVDELLPPAMQQTGPVTLKWLGAFEGGWLTALLDLDRATDVDSFREALRPWHVPTFAVVVADLHGAIAFQSTGRIPVRGSLERGCRSGWDPAQQWHGLIPFESMPSIDNPPRGWIATANNRLAPHDYPYKLFGCWSGGWRAKRIRQMIEERPQISPADMRMMQQDAVSLRAAELVPALLPLIEQHPDAQIRSAAELLRQWNFSCDAEAAAPAVFNVFFSRWCRKVAAQRFGDELVDLMADACAGCAGRLLHADAVGWFDGSDRRRAVADAFAEAICVLSDQFGPNQQHWAWGKLHRMPLRHVLSSRGSLGELLNHGGAGVRGDMVTVCNTGNGPQWSAASGAGYRLISDLSVRPPVLNAVDGQSQSGHPGSPHYSDQFETWKAGSFHELPLVRDSLGDSCEARIIFSPVYPSPA